MAPIKRYKQWWAAFLGALLVLISNHDKLLELYVQYAHKGVNVGIFVTAYVLFRKEMRNRKLDKRDIDYYLNQRTIMQELGVGDQWRGPQRPLQRVRISLSKPLHSYLGDIYQAVSKLRRTKTMEQKVNWVTLIPALVGAIKLILQPFGIDLTFVTDEKVNDIANGVAALAAIIGILATNRKPSVKIYEPTPKGGTDLAQYSNAIQSNK